MVTLADVARLAKVSTMTVSKVLRGTGAISDETKTRVFEAADQLGYVPNRLAGSLSTRKSMNSHSDAIDEGIDAVYQTLALADHLDPASNMSNLLLMMLMAITIGMFAYSRVQEARVARQRAAAEKDDD